MVFTSAIFLFAFLPITLISYYACKKNYRNLVLFIFSVIFYAWGGAQYAVLVVASAFVNYFVGIRIERSITDKQRKHTLIFGVVFNLAILSVFKYFNFFVDGLESFLSLIVGQEIVFNEPIIPLPIGISFFTFQILSYVIDVYRKNVPAQKSFINLGLYIMLFPQLIAGPIVRYIDVEKEIQNRHVTLDSVRYGITRFIFGFAKKILIANIMGNLSDTLLDNIEKSPMIFSWGATICFALQIFFDFSAYSDMAIGLGRIFGFTFLENFNYPYISTSIQEFWRRWHISLSSWFKDYLYIPLGGNRNGLTRTYINLLIVFFATGLWHGASWNFVIWGLFHGAFLILERTKIVSTILQKAPIVIKRTYTLVVVLVGWVFFDILSLNDALTHITYMFSMDFSYWETILFYINTQDLVIFIIAICFCFPPKTNGTEKFFNTTTSGVIISDMCKIALFLISISYMFGSSFNPFIYFRF